MSDEGDEDTIVVHAVALTLLLSLVVGWAGRHRRLGFWAYFFASLALTPLVGALLVIVSAPAPSDGESHS